MLSPAELHSISTRARTLSERIAATSSTPSRGASDSVSVEPSALEDLDTWSRAFSPGDTPAFTRRLLWDGLTLEQALAVVSGEQLRQPAAWTRWLDKFEQGLSHHTNHAFELPFAEFWSGVVHAATSELSRHRPASTQELSASAREALERQLAKELAFAGELPLYREFRSEEGRGYRAFIDSICGAGFAPLVLKYPFLARQLAIICECWVRNSIELLERVEIDHAGARVTGIEPGLSDPHHGRRRVAILTFESGNRLVYKPRDVGCERALNDLIAWLNDRGLQPAQRSVPVLERSSYGWMEFVEHEPFSSDDEVRAYFRQCGGLMALAWLFGGRDLHWENLIASRQGPVVVDAELWLHPLAPGEPPGSALETGLLSLLQLGPDGDTVDVGALRADQIAAGPTAERVWTGLGTDALAFTEERAAIPPRKNRVLRGGAVIQPDAYAQEILDGFTRTCRFVAGHRDALLSDAGPLASSRAFRTRVLIRPSHQYAASLQALANPKYLTEGLRWCCALDALNRRFRTSEARPGTWPLAVAEREALEQLDLPYFWTPSHSRAIYAGEQVLVDDHFMVSGHEAAASRLRALTPEDITREGEGLARALRQSTSSRFATELTLAASSATDHRAILTEAAAWIGSELLSLAQSNGGLEWPYASPPPANALAKHRLYDGTSGVALFLAALGAVTGDRKWIDATAGAVTATRKDVADLTAGPRVPTGAATGIGSLVYALTTIGRLLGDRASIDLAVDLAGTLTPAVIDADRSCDVSDGLGGAVLALLAADHAAPGRGLLARAEYCGKAILSRQVSANHGGAWPTLDGVLLAGFAHGAAGIAYALTRLHQATGERFYLDAIRRAHAYERGLFSIADRNWPVLAANDGAPSAMMTAWCHGAPGVILARALSAATLNDPEISVEIGAGLEATARLGAGQSDHVCCGNLGRAEVLLTVGYALNSVEPIGAALSIAGSVVKKAQARGHFKLTSSGFEYEVFAPGFFKGLSGIGYSLLRLAHPGRLPSVLGYTVVRGA
jgi:type 2 lantibiotic biosynthesis protein LanM